jgi:hypothetical protein
MIAITREHLDALAAETEPWGRYDDAGDVILPLIAALRRVHDVCDDPSRAENGQEITTIQRVRDALAGEQTEETDA